MKLVSLLLRNKIITIILTIGLLILLFGIAGNIIVQRKYDNWPAQNQRNINSIISSVNQTLNYHKQKFILEKNEILVKLKSLQSFDFGSINKLSEIINLDPFKVGIYENDSLVFWNERYDEIINSDDTLDFNLGEIYFLNSGINTYLAVRDTFSIKENTYELNLYKIIEKHYRLNSDYFQNINLTEALTKQTGVEINIDYYQDSQFTKDGRKQSFSIFNNENNKIGTVTFVKPGREESILNVKNTISSIQGILLLIGFLLLGIVVNKEVLNNSRTLIKSFFLVLYLFILRYLLIFIKFPQNLFSSELLSDKFYYSSFGNGIANSPGDLLVTLIFGFALMYYALKNSVKFINNGVKGKFGIIVSSCLIFLLITLYLISLRGTGAAIRGTVFDTSLRYFQSTSLSLTLPHLIMHINILLLGLISLLGSSTIIVWILQIWKGRIAEIRLENYFYLFLLILAGVFIIAFLQNTPQLNFTIKTIHLILVLISVYLLLNLDLSGITRTIIFFIFASIFSISSLLFYNSELEKSSLKTTASIISRYDDNWYKSLIAETLLSNFTRKQAESAFKSAKNNFNVNAFKIWSKSQLQQEAINSSVNFINLSGTLLGGFGSIYPSLNIDRFIDTNTIIEEIQIFEEPTENESQKLIRGIFPVKDEFAFLGYIDVSILADMNDFGFSTHPQFISTGKLNEKSILKLDKLIILDYRDSDLKIVYGDLNPNLRFNEKVLNADFTSSNDAWIEINFNESDYLVYVKKTQMNEIERIIAVALKDKELSISLFDFFKVFFSHTLILLIVMLVYFIYFYGKKIKYQFDLRKKLLLAFLIISLIPLILTALYFRNLTDEKNKNAIYYKLGKRAFSIDEYLNDNYSLFTQNNLYERASEDLNIGYTVYRQNNIEYSTNDLIYDVGLIPKIINPLVYEELIINASQEILVHESVDNFQYDAFYYKTSFLGDEIVIKVTNGFNKILLPFSGSEVDIFLFGFYSLAVVLILIFSAIIANQISKPLRKITMATKSVAAGDLSLELKNNAKGELGDLVSSFQYMIKELNKNQTLLAEIEREEAWKEMAKQVAHEIKNPLTPMKLSVQQLITSYNDRSEKFEILFKKVTSTILNQIEALKNIATEFSHLARMPKLKLEQINFVEILNQSIDLFTDENIEIKLEFPLDIILIKGDSEQLRRTFINLIRNSIQAEATQIKFFLNETNDSFEIYISDNGKGISEGDISKIFEPNFTTKKEGMGLGLSMAKRYLRSSSGDISVDKSSAEGTTIKISLSKF